MLSMRHQPPGCYLGDPPALTSFLLTNSIFQQLPIPLQRLP